MWICSRGSSRTHCPVAPRQEHRRAACAPLLQALTNEFRQRFLAGGEHEHGGMRRLSQMPGGGRARPFGAARELINDLLCRAPIGERNLVKRQSQVCPGEGKGVKAGLGTGPRHAEGIVRRFKRPAVDRLSGIRCHRLADRRWSMQMIAAARFARKCNNGAAKNAANESATLEFPRAARSRTSAAHSAAVPATCSPWRMAAASST